MVHKNVSSRKLGFCKVFDCLICFFLSGVSNTASTTRLATIPTVLGQNFAELHRTCLFHVGFQLLPVHTIGQVANVNQPLRVPLHLKMRCFFPFPFPFPFSVVNQECVRAEAHLAHALDHPHLGHDGGRSLAFAFASLTCAFASLAAPMIHKNVSARQLTFCEVCYGIICFFHCRVADTSSTARFATVPPILGQYLAKFYSSSLFHVRLQLLPLHTIG
mmetsp:Transcript_8208/g.13671  ORF Transcript_8208/g.13671 Transcript_8208/m.13671 type:complete len:218 (+) Transcript_8208:3-656(+)